MRRADPHRVLVVATFGAAVRGLGPDELLEAAGGERRVIEDAIALADHAGVLRGPYIEAGARLRVALSQCEGRGGSRSR